VFSCICAVIYRRIKAVCTRPVGLGETTVGSGTSQSSIPKIQTSPHGAFNASHQEFSRSPLTKKAA